MSGPQLAARLAPLRPEMRILYMTGYADDAIVHRGVISAGQALLVKPFTSLGLAHEVKKALRELAGPERSEGTRLFSVRIEPVGRSSSDLAGDEELADLEVARLRPARAGWGSRAADRRAPARPPGGPPAAGPAATCSITDGPRRGLPDTHSRPPSGGQQLRAERDEIRVVALHRPGGGARGRHRRADRG